MFPVRTGRSKPATWHSPVASPSPNARCAARHRVLRRHAGAVGPGTRRAAGGLADRGVGRADPRERPTLELFVAALDQTRVWWGDLEADVANGNDVYASVIEDWAAVSVGAFEPDQIEETWESEAGPVTVRFTLGGKDVELAPEYLEDWIDPRIISPINERIAASGRQLTLVEASTRPPSCWRSTRASEQPSKPAGGASSRTPRPRSATSPPARRPAGCPDPLPAAPIRPGPERLGSGPKGGPAGPPRR